MLDLLRKYRVPLLAGGLVLAAMLLYSSGLRQRERTTLFERTVLRLTAPLQELLDRTLEGAGDLWRRLRPAAAENERLRAELRRLQAELQQMEEVRLANARLQRLLDLREDLAAPALPARVIAEDASSWFRTVVIDRGREDGLREGMPAVAAEGLAGRVVKSAPGQSRVLLITDASSAVAVVIQRTRARGICRGQGGLLSFDFAGREEEIEVGDIVVTSGAGGVFPKGLTVGQVIRVERGGYGLFQTVTVAPAVDFSRLEELLILTGGRP